MCHHGAVSASLLRGLRILEMLADEPLGVSELARRLEVDKGGVSRVMGALEAEGWVVRTGNLFVLGERALGLTAVPLLGPLLAEAAEVTGRLHERTGLTAVALVLAGRGAQPLSMAGAAGFDVVRREARPFDSLVATAGGIALLAQLPPGQVRARLALDPWPDIDGDGPQDAVAVEELIAQVAAGGVVEECGWTVPGLACIAAPWRPRTADRPLALAVLGPVAEVTSRRGDVVGLLTRRTTSQPPSA
jgi:DNA-binding IclR family transcriptional regulator